VLKVLLKKFSNSLTYLGSLFFSPLLLLANSPLPPENYEVESALGMDLIWVDVHSGRNPVTHTKGSPDNENGRNEDENQHLVTLTQGFYLGKFEVKQAEYEAVLRANNPYDQDSFPSGFPSPENPVENISWNDALYFIDRLNEIEANKGNLPTGWAYILPSEAEWEYACRANSNTAYTFGDSLESNQSNFRPAPLTDSEPIKVGQYAPNAFGFYDMHGNVSEWCLDWYVKDLNGSFSDPTGPIYSADFRGNYRDPMDFIFYDPLDPVTFLQPKKVCRGGSFNDSVLDLRSARRFPVSINDKWTYTGFRLALKKTEPDISLEYATTFSSVTNMVSDLYEIEGIWEDNGESLVYSINRNELAGLLLPDNSLLAESTEDNLSVCLRLEYSDLFSTLNRFGQTVPGLGYAVYLSEKDSLGNWVYQLQNSESSASVGWIDPSNLQDHFSSFLGYGSAQWIADSMYVVQRSGEAISALRHENLTGTFSEFLNQAIEMGNGWKWAKWFGYYYANQYPWVYHKNLGWTFVAQSHSHNTWLFREHMGWAWTTAPEWWLENERPSSVSKSHSPTFPYLFRYGHDENDTKAWTYINPHLTETTLYDFDHAKWFELDRPYDIHVTVIPEGSGTASGTGQYHHWSKVPLFAAPNPNYNFLYWSVDQIPSPEAQFFATSDRSIQASFMPIIQPNQSGSSIAEQYKELLSYREDLTELEKEKAYFELLFYGNSPTAGIQ